MLVYCVVFQVSRVIDEHKAEIIDKGYQFNIGLLISEQNISCARHLCVVR